MKRKQEKQKQKKRDTKKLRMEESIPPSTPQALENEEEMKRPIAEVTLESEEKIHVAKRQLLIKDTSPTILQASASSVRTQYIEEGALSPTPPPPPPPPTQFSSFQATSPSHTVEKIYRKEEVVTKISKVQKHHREKISLEAASSIPFRFAAPDAPMLRVLAVAPATATPEPEKPKVAKSGSNSTFKWASGIVIVVLVCVIGYQYKTMGDLQDTLKLCHCNISNKVTTGIQIPVFEEPGSISVIKYLNAASEHFAGKAFTFVPYDEQSPTHRLAIFSMHFMGRLDSSQEDVISKLKAAGVDNVVLSALRINAPGKESSSIDLPSVFSGYKCGELDTPLIVELGYYILANGEEILPFDCSNIDGHPPETKANPCSYRNQKQLKNFFQHLEKLTSTKCTKTKTKIDEL